MISWKGIGVAGAAPVDQESDHTPLPATLLKSAELLENTQLATDT